MDCKNYQSRINVYAGSNDILYWLYNRLLKEKPECLVFLLFGEVWRLLDSILAVDFCYTSLGELYYGLIIPLDKGALTKNLSLVNFLQIKLNEVLKICDNWYIYILYIYIYI